MARRRRTKLAYKAFLYPDPGSQPTCTPIRIGTFPQVSDELVPVLGSGALIAVIVFAGVCHGQLVHLDRGAAAGTGCGCPSSHDRWARGRS